MVAAPATSPSQLPVEVHCHGGPIFRSAVAETQGLRPSYEDAYAITSEGQTVYFWVFDGHRGDCASRFAAELFGSKEFSPSDDKLPSDRRIRRAFRTVDSRLRDHLCQVKSGNAGSTAVGALAARNRDGTYSAKLVNCGDSRCVVIHAPGENKMSRAAIQVKLPRSLESFCEAPETNWSQDASWLPDWPAVVETIDHKPSLWFERARIEAAGGTVCGGRTARLDGNLAVSRSLGDFDFKCNDGRPAAEQKVSCLPDIYEVSGLPEGTLLLLACDGLWDAISSEEAAQFVHERLRYNPPMELDEIAQELIDFSLEAKTRDNVTVLLAQLGYSQDSSEGEAD
ncbi:unnamed protein product [Effrenium voratum]|uniref:protein-serine/threonine phosphatase n=1 Tax=Effrenium voratum TaxID=2562239 RepID=A0AA36MP15_9DINO|nr:unnamed protein product [Effrenium voratum]CAJ1375075.1 unnamed protein product [Effrenium voratum]|mmetsp:Transcript_79408/g.190646  ORF Transcript_79408/g.190646 Transcript_79408/m.190646 type:complete len:340 (+) Transcript_79408:46-1065(+)|eukprot:CAMPEP_0181464898 /NCGR_PEP_ID=MMETSP1110-20121109/35671_1 /TAXON_ID=174948 /ORGANISM="Symbiodinium sp., Strain CCMP421" /LENGTH=339 /DNA_ID=CAMNT_0023589649 /DNA_START=89 /DNA_END=1108 /DNA_ORIENTATION=+